MILVRLTGFGGHGRDRPLTTASSIFGWLVRLGPIAKVGVACYSTEG